MATDGRRKRVNSPAKNHSHLGAPPFGARIAAGGALAVTGATLRVCIGRRRSGAAPAFQRTPLKVSTLLGLGRIVSGRSSGIVTVESGRDT